MGCVGGAICFMEKHANITITGSIPEIRDFYFRTWVPHPSMPSGIRPSEQLRCVPRGEQTRTASKHEGFLKSAWEHPPQKGVAH